MEGASESRVKSDGGGYGNICGWVCAEGGKGEIARLVGRGCLEEFVDWRLKIQFKSTNVRELFSCGVVQPGVTAVLSSSSSSSSSSK